MENWLYKCSECGLDMSYNSFEKGKKRDFISFVCEKCDHIYWIPLENPYIIKPEK